jgi:hypothetical protein
VRGQLKFRTTRRPSALHTKIILNPSEKEEPKWLGCALLFTVWLGGYSEKGRGKEENQSPPSNPPAGCHHSASVRLYILSKPGRSGSVSAGLRGEPAAHDRERTERCAVAQCGLAAGYYGDPVATMACGLSGSPGGPWNDQTERRGRCLRRVSREHELDPWCAWSAGATLVQKNLKKAGSGSKVQPALRAKSRPRREARSNIEKRAPIGADERVSRPAAPKASFSHPEKSSPNC